MTTYNQGDVVVVDFPATSGQPGKTRPSLVVFDAGDADLIFAKLTTAARRSTYDVQLSDWAAAGLRAHSRTSRQIDYVGKVTCQTYHGPLVAWRLSGSRHCSQVDVCDLVKADSSAEG